MLVFSNYNVDRIWYTTNGGTSWTSESGNLNAVTGPSIRWAEIFNVGGVTHYFLATSTGVYFTTTLNGNSTTWTQEATSSVGNAVCSMLDYRPSDNTIAVATHGRGIFTSTISSPLPVELISFTGGTSNGHVNLAWKTETESNNSGFEIDRAKSIEDQHSNNKSGLENFTRIGFIKGSGNSNSPKQYTYTDNSTLSGKYYYRLKLIDNDGQFKYSKVVEVDINAPGEFMLNQNYPNPFNPTTTIQYAIPKSEHVTLKVYDEIGREVASLVDENKEAGRYNITFNGSNLASGIYFYRLQAGKFSSIKKLILLK